MTLANTKGVILLRTLKYTIIALGVIAVIGIGAYFYIVNSFTSSSELVKTADKIIEREAQPLQSSYENEIEMSEHEIQVYIHQMTHQHVIADKKWGGVPTSSDNIKNLLTIVQANQDFYEYSEYYIDVLNKWGQGDFSNAVEVHNTIWSWHGGTIGRATGLLK